MAFHFRGFSVEHEASAQKIGTDSVLLGGFLRLYGAELGLNRPQNTGVDVGAGCGVLGFILAKHESESRVFLVEMDAESAQESAQNIKNLGLEDRVFSFNDRIPDWIPPQKLDWIISNPPYFVGPESSNPRRDGARNQKHLPPELLADLFTRWIKPGGWMALVLPAPSAYVPHLGDPTVWIRISTRPGEPPKRHIAVWTLSGAERLRSIPSATWSLYDASGAPSAEFKKYAGDLLLRIPSDSRIK